MQAGACLNEWNEEEKKIDVSHNPFSMPNIAPEEFIALEATAKPTSISSYPTGRAAGGSVH
jgi:aspartyl-tRNA synthetase